MEVHFTDAAKLEVEFVDSKYLAAVFGHEPTGVESALVFEDVASSKLFVCCGTQQEIRDLVHDILRMMRIQSPHVIRRTS